MDKIKKVLKENGIVPCDDPEITEKFIEYIKDSIEYFPELFLTPFRICDGEYTQIMAYCVGYNEDASTDGKFTDGRCLNQFRIRDDNNKLETRSIICIHEAAIKAGREYTILVFWHELTHAITDTDNPLLFHAMLDGLLNAYEKRTGEHIENDYCVPV